MYACVTPARLPQGDLKDAKAELTRAENAHSEEVAEKERLVADLEGQLAVVCTGWGACAAPISDSIAIFLGQRPV